MTGLTASKRRVELLFVVGRIAHGFAYDEPAFYFQRGLRVVALLKASTCFHDAAFFVGEVVLVPTLRFFAGRFGGASAGLFAGPRLLFFARFLFGFKLGELLAVALFGSRFDDDHCVAKFLNAVATAGDFAGDGESVFERRAVGVVRLREQLVDLLSEQKHLFYRVVVAHSAVFARVGEDFGAVDSERHIAHAQHFDARRRFEHLVKAALEKLLIFHPKSADAVVVGMGVRGEQTHGDVFVGESLDAPTAKRACGVAINEQPEHHPRRILLAAAAAVVDARTAQIQHPDGLHDEVDEVILRHPRTQIRRQ